MLERRRELVNSASLKIRAATPEDVPAVAALFAADELGGHGDTTDPVALPGPRSSASPQALPTASTSQNWTVGWWATFQTTLMTTMTGRGSSSLAIEAV